MAKRARQRKVEQEVAVPDRYSSALDTWLSDNDFADTTRLVYDHAVTSWLKFARPWSAGWEKRTIQWSASLDSRALKTKALYVGAAKKFLERLRQDGVTKSPRNPLYTVRFRKTKSSGIKRRALTDDEVKALVASCDTGTILGMRDLCILRIMLYTALRIAAVAGIMIGDLFRSKGTWYVIYKAKGQNSKQRNKPLDDLVWSSIEEYLKATGRNSEGKGPLFLTGKRRITTTGIRKMIKRRFARCDIVDRTVSIHSLRHTAATKAIEMGISMRDLQIFLDHESIATTEGYVHDRRELDSVQSFHISYGEGEGPSLD